jgi:hypothetical protein
MVLRAGSLSMTREEGFCWDGGGYFGLVMIYIAGSQKIPPIASSLKTVAFKYLKKVSEIRWVVNLR